MISKAIPELRIGDLARELGLGVETIRFYEQRGLVEPISRRPSGYRVYDVRAVERLRFVQRAKSLGFTLEEIRELLDLNSELGQTDSPGACAPIKARIHAKRSAVEARIRDLQALLAGLEALDLACDGSSDLSDCPILQTLRGEKSCEDPSADPCAEFGNDLIPESCPHSSADACAETCAESGAEPENCRETLEVPHV